MKKLILALMITGVIGSVVAEEEITERLKVGKVEVNVYIEESVVDASADFIDASSEVTAPTEINTSSTDQSYTDAPVTITEAPEATAGE